MCNAFMAVSLPSSAPLPPPPAAPPSPSLPLWMLIWKTSWIIRNALKRERKNYATQIVVVVVVVSIVVVYLFSFDPVRLQRICEPKNRNEREQCTNDVIVFALYEIASHKRKAHRINCYVRVYALTTFLVPISMKSGHTTTTKRCRYSYICWKWRTRKSKQSVNAVSFVSWMHCHQVGSTTTEYR